MYLTSNAKLLILNAIRSLYHNSISECQLFFTMASRPYNPARHSYGSRRNQNSNGGSGISSGDNVGNGFRPRHYGSPSYSSYQQQNHQQRPPQQQYPHQHQQHQHQQQQQRQYTQHSRDETRYQQGPPRNNQYHHHHHHQVNKQHQPTKQQLRESALQAQIKLASQYKIDNVDIELLRQLDIHPRALEDLLSPGKGVGHLHEIMAVAENHYKTKPIHFNAEQLGGEWYISLTIYYPEEKKFTCKHKNKKECKNIACLAAVYHLRQNLAVDCNLKISMKTSMTSFNDNSRGPVTIPNIPINMAQQMMSFISKYDECVADLLEYRIEETKKNFETYDSGVEGKHEAVLEGLEPDEPIFSSSNTGSNNDNSNLPRSGILDMFTSRLYNPPDATKRAHGFAQLNKVYLDKKMKQERDPVFDSLMQNQSKLPIRSYNIDIIQALHSHRAIVVAGDTGCGKSTQVPQFLLEDFIQSTNNSNSFINIAVTQPRRISAISLAERVAIELGEQSTGLSVGHNVRFDSKLPRRDVNIVSFFTTGMLLKKLQRNPDLKGVTHLVVDEVHERDCATDFLLILIKRILDRRRDLRVIFMSASMDANLFAKYFDNCPVISVPGRCHPVSDVFLEDIQPDVNRQYSSFAPKLNIKLVYWLIEHIDRNRGDGAILCFMPGWKEMKALNDELKHSKCNLKVVMTHSKLPISEQRLIFSKPQPGQRKVILATNIAETSITINDVCFVIDTGLCNSIDYDPELNMSTFGTRWISKANAKQRSGRAGRTSPGECFKLYSRHEESNFQDYPFPELLRIPLESVIMDAKCHCPEERAVDFLSQAIQHPSVNAIHSALDELTFLGVLDQQEHLTTLGRRISNFTTHPRLSVSLVLSAALKCLYPILNATAMLSSTQDPFLLSLTEKSLIRQTKKILCEEVIGPGLDPTSYMSDHVALANLLAQYDSASTSRSEQEYYVTKNNLNPSAMIGIQTCRNYHANMMIASKFVNSYEWSSFDSSPNRNMNEIELFIGCVVHAFYPKLIRLVKGTVKNNRLYPNRVSATDVPSNKKVRFVSDSVVRNISLGRFSEAGGKDDDSDSDEGSDYASMDNTSSKPSFIAYMNSRADQESNLIVIRDGSVVPVLALALFGGREFTIQELPPNAKNRPSTNEDTQVIITMDRQSLVSFKTTMNDAIIIRDWRNVWQRYLEWFIHTKNCSQAVDQNDSIIGQTMNDFLETTKKLFASTT